VEAVSATVPNDIVPSLDLGEVRMSVYGDNVYAVTLRFVDGALPLKVGERVEVEVVAIERSVVER
jgi:hypothetical protein